MFLVKLPVEGTEGSVYIINRVHINYFGYYNNILWLVLVLSACVKVYGVIFSISVAYACLLGNHVLVGLFFIVVVVYFAVTSSLVLVLVVYICLFCFRLFEQENGLWPLSTLLISVLNVVLVLYLVFIIY